MKYSQLFHKGYDFRVVGEIDEKAMHLIVGLADNNALKQFELWTHGMVSRDGKQGNCHFATPALLCDLIKARAAAGWQYAVGTFTQPYHGTWLHSWLEHGDLALNCSNASWRPIYLINKHDFYTVNNAEDIEHFAPGFVKQIWTKRRKFVGTPEFNRVSSLHKEYKHDRR